MSHRLDDVQVSTSAVADLLSGTVLDPMPGNGFIRVYVANSVPAGTITITPASHPPPTGSGSQVIPEAGSGDSAANHPVIAAFMPHWETEVKQGEKVVIALGGTVTEVLSWVSFMGA